jgi:aminodeoxychorismate lyase
MIVFLNGKFLLEGEASVSVSDRGFLLGDGLFETLRVANGKPFRPAQHWERLGRGADFLKIKLPYTPQELSRLVTLLIEKNRWLDAVLRVTLTRGAGRRGYSIQGAELPTLAMTLSPLPPPNPDGPVQWSLITSSFRIPASDALAAFKTTSKLVNVLARAEAEEQGADEALLVNTNGEIAETAGGNIFWIYRDQICTTPVGRGALPGITRAVVLEICQKLGLATNKCSIKPDQLRQSDGIFITQSAWGIIPVVSFDGQSLAPSPLMGQIASAYAVMLAEE